MMHSLTKEDLSPGKPTMDDQEPKGRHLSLTPKPIERESLIGPFDHDQEFN